MKNIFIISILIVLIIGCSTKSKKNNQAEIEAERINQMKSDSLVNLAELSNANISELPLGFNFNMSENEVNDLKNKLIESKILEGSGDDRFIKYTYTTKDGITVEYWVKFDFYEDKLYSLVFDFVYGYELDSIYNAIIKDFNSKLDSSYIRTKYKSDYWGDGDTFFSNHWIKNNQIIWLRRSKHGVKNLSYINAPIYRIVSNEASERHEAETRSRYRMKDLVPYL